MVAGADTGCGGNDDGLSRLGVAIVVATETNVIVMRLHHNISGDFGHQHRGQDHGSS